MAGQVRVQRDIIAEPPEVWMVLTDLDRYPKVLTSVDAVERLEGVGFEVGTRWRETRRMYGKVATEELWVADIDPGRRVVVHTEAKGTVYEAVYEVLPSSLGTRLVITYGAETSKASAGQRLALAVMGPLGSKAVKASLEQDLVDFAAAVESSHRR